MNKNQISAISLQIVGEVAEDQIETWKRSLDIKSIPFLEVRQEGEDEISIAYLKPADRDVLARALSLYNSGQVIEAGEVVLQTCWLGGDERLKSPKGLRQERTAARAAQLAFGAIALPEGHAGVK